MNILLLNTNIGYGGASKMMIWVANQLAGYGYNITFVTFRNNTVLQPISDKVNHVHLNLEDDSKHKANIIKTSIAIRDFIKTGKYDLAIGFLSPSFIRLFLATLGLKTKLLFSHRGDPFQKRRRFSLGTFISEFAFKHADNYVFQTEAAKDFYSYKIQNKSTVICNPVIPLTNTPERNPNLIEPRIVNIARLDIKQKRQDILIKAFNIISKDYPEVVLELYGDGPDLKNLMALASRNPRIIFKGKTSDVASALKNARFFVLTSDFEGIPNALLESMSAGVPSISTDCSPGGAAMLINNYENGILVPRDDINELANAMKYMLNNFTMAEKMGKNAKSVNQIYSEQAISNKWIDFIESISES